MNRTNRMTRLLLSAAAASGLLLATTPAMMTTSSVTLAATQNNKACASPYNITVDPNNFQTGSTPNPINNPYMPLTPTPPNTKKIFTFDGTKDGQPEHDVVTVTSNHPQIMGVYTTEVQDNVSVGGQLIETTKDWYAQDTAGNVWYFGEYSTDLPGNTHEGSWTAGVNGALPGIVMEAQPKNGDTYRQEFAPPSAEDMASITSMSSHLTVTYGSYDNVLVTKEFSCVETGAEHKYYGLGAGLLQVVAVSSGKNGSEQLQLTSIQQM